MIDRGQRIAPVLGLTAEPTHLAVCRVNLYEAQESRSVSGFLVCVVVGLPGIEPGLHDPQPCVLPVYYSPIRTTS